jgi:cobalt-zinc-cadmium efflux system membrane fusion protein
MLRRRAPPIGEFKVKTRGGLPKLKVLKAGASLLLAAGVAGFLAVSYFAGSTGVGAAQNDHGAAARAVRRGNAGQQFAELNGKQVASLKIGPVGERGFELTKTAVGTIDFNQNMPVQVFSQYPGELKQLIWSGISASGYSR